MPQFKKRKIVNEADADDDEDDDISLVKYLNNHIYFYSPVSLKTCLELNILINKLSNEIINKAILESRLKPKEEFLGLINNPLYIHINSSGGEVMAALSSVDTIRNCKVPIISIIEGEACSAATLISTACHKRQIFENSMMLIHQISGGVWGKMAEFEDEMKNMKSTTELVINLYRKYTKINDIKLTKILKKDLMWDSKKCLKNGLVDEII
jgi:ATP-dependent protease ClpP protease subunit